MEKGGGGGEGRTYPAIAERLRWGGGEGRLER